MTNRKLAYIAKNHAPLVLDRNATVRHACQVMTEHRAGSVLVIDDALKLCGIFTGRDAVAAIAAGRDSENTRLAVVMTPNPVTLRPEERAIDALSAMSSGGFRHVPIVENGTIIGVVSRGDFTGMEFEEFDWEAFYKATHTTANRQIASIVMGQTPLVLTTHDTAQDACRAMTERGSGSVLVVNAVGELSGIFTGRDAVILSSQVADGAATPLQIAMKHSPITIGLRGTAIDALRLMSEGGFRHLPVVSDGKICGVISRSDFTGLEIDRLDEEVHLAECIW